MKIINKRNAFNLFASSKWNALWFCTTYYSLGSPCCFRSDNNASPCTTHFCDKNLSCIFILHLTSFADWTQTRYEWVTILVCKKLYRGRKTYSYSIYLACICFSIPKKTLSVSWMDSTLWKMCNILMNIILIKRKKGKIRRRYSDYNFS